MQTGPVGQCILHVFNYRTRSVGVTATLRSVVVLVSEIRRYRSIVVMKTGAGTGSERRPALNVFSGFGSCFAFKGGFPPQNRC